MYQIIPFNEDNEEIWDDLVMNRSVNGTFLQTRRFLNYHPRDRFRDCSILFYYNDKLAAVCPANIVEEDGKKKFFSHQGSTYGGMVIAKKYYKTKYVITMVEELKDYVKAAGYDELYLKLTPEIFSINASLLEYSCYYNGFSEYKEINPYIDFAHYLEPVIKNLSQGKRTNVHNCEKENLQVRTLNLEEEINEYYDILCENLQKYGLKPVHSLEELLDLKNNRIKEECEFFGVYLGDVLVAGGMMFYFKNVLTAHTQYLSAKQKYAVLSPMSYLYYWIIKTMKERGYQKLSWGICTEEHGKELNLGLIGSKEFYGGTYSNNYTCYIKF